MAAHLFLEKRGPLGYRFDSEGKDKARKRVG